MFQQSYKQLADISETELFYQFTRFDPDSLQFINMHAYLKRMYWIVEYLWMFTPDNNYSNAVLESYATETDDEFLHILKQSKLDFSYI